MPLDGPPRDDDGQSPSRPGQRDPANSSGPVQLGSAIISFEHRDSRLEHLTSRYPVLTYPHNALNQNADGSNEQNIPLPQPGSSTTRPTGNQDGDMVFTEMNPFLARLRASIASRRSDSDDTEPSTRARLERAHRGVLGFLENHGSPIATTADGEMGEDGRAGPDGSVNRNDLDADSSMAGLLREIQGGSSSSSGEAATGARRWFDLLLERARGRGPAATEALINRVMRGEAVGLEDLGIEDEDVEDDEEDDSDHDHDHEFEEEELDDVAPRPIFVPRDMTTAERNALSLARRLERYGGNHHAERRNRSLEWEPEPEGSEDDLDGSRQEQRRVAWFARRAQRVDLLERAFIETDALRAATIMTNRELGTRNEAIEHLGVDHRSLPGRMFWPDIVGQNAHRLAVAPTIITSSHSSLTPRSSTAQWRPSLAESTEAAPAMSDLHRTKSTKRRKLDSTGNRRKGPICGEEPAISKISLPEYLQLGNMHLTAVPTALNRADCAARLALTTKELLGTVQAGSKPPSGEPLLGVCFVGTGERDDLDASAVRANHPIPSSCGVFYYEVEIVSKGRDGYISIGFAGRSTDLNRLVGWEENSWGWHMDDGYLFECRGEGTSKGWPKSTTGDVIGCGIDFTTGQAFFTRNGEFIGNAFSGLAKRGRLFPAVGLRTPGEKLLLNFEGPFKYDIISHVKRVQLRVRTQVTDSSVYMRLPNPPCPHSSAEAQVKEEKGLASKVHACVICSSADQRRKAVPDIDSALSGAVLEYLKGNGYLGAARAMQATLNTREKRFSATIDDNSEMEVDDALGAVDTEGTEEDSFQMLRACQEAYSQGDMHEAIRIYLDSENLLGVGNETLRTSRSGIWPFRLKIQLFYQLLREQTVEHDWKSQSDLLNRFNAFVYGSTSDAPEDRMERLLAVGQGLQQEYGSSPKKEIESGLKAFALIVYEDLASAPEELKQGMSEKIRRKEAEELFTDIRVCMGYPAVSTLEQAYRQTSTIIHELGCNHGVAEAAYVELPKP